MKTFLKNAMVVMLIAVSASSCFPGDPNCSIQIDRIDNIPNVTSIAEFTPLQNEYQVGDTLRIIVNIPSQVEISGFMYDMYGSTGDATANVSLGNLDLLIGDQEFVITKGNRIENNARFRAFYSINCDCYEFEGFIVLTETGMTFIDLFDIIIDIRDSDCDGFSLEQDILWVNGSREIEYEVLP